MITVQDLFFTYPGHNHEVLHNLSFDVAKGDVLVIAGANGSGKSTLLTLLAGIVEPSSGSIFFDHDEDEKVHAPVCRLVMQNADLQILGSTPHEDLNLSSASKQPHFTERVQNLVQQFFLDDVLDSPVHTLSWGQKRKLCIAAAILDTPDCLLFDEPFSGLDYPACREMRTIIREHQARGLTQIISAHDLEPLADLTDRFIILDKGQLVLQGEPLQVFPHIQKHNVKPPASWLINGSITPWDTPHET